MSKTERVIQFLISKELESRLDMDTDESEYEYHLGRNEAYSVARHVIQSILEGDDNA